MKINDRIKFWKKLAQTADDQLSNAPTVSSAPIITLSQIPTFKVNLFSNKPEFGQDIQTIINILNKYLFMLSNGKVDFSMTWRNPSINPSLFTNSIKNIFTISKWIYSILSTDGKPYSTDALKKITKDLNDLTVKMDFPDPKASGFKSEIISVAQVISNKLGS